jgi:hypothetical protein
MRSTEPELTGALTDANGSVASPGLCLAVGAGVQGCDIHRAEDMHKAVDYVTVKTAAPLFQL